MHSCIYEGIVRHRRCVPVVHEFQYRLFMVYLDLDELPSLVGRDALIGQGRLAARSFLRSDHLFDARRSLEEELRQMVRDQTGKETAGPIRLLTQLRYFGLYMSPLNLFYVFDASGQRIESIVAEVNNTPWNERHCYVLWDGNRSASNGELCFAHRKDFHVSPFMPMDVDYRWRLSSPENELYVRLASHRDERQVFDADMKLSRRELSRHQLRRMTFGHPWMTAQIASGIYSQALKLWWKKCPFYKHPKKLKHDPKLAQPVHGLTTATSNTPR